jgi:hypothetical protein
MDLAGYKSTAFGGARPDPRPDRGRVDISTKVSVDLKYPQPWLLRMEEAAAAPTGGHPTTDPATGPALALEFHSRRKFWWKTSFLAAATIALIPILLSQHELAALIYIAFLVVIHVVGLVIFAIGVKREDIAPTRRGLWNRITGIVVAVVLLYMVSKGLQTPAESWIFWTSLFLIWFIHTAALLMLHLRGRGERRSACPFA